MPKNTSWPDWLRAAIDRSGKRKYSLAKAAERSHATISQQLKGQKPSRNMVIDLATATFPGDPDKDKDALKRHIDSGLIAAGFQPLSAKSSFVLDDAESSLVTTYRAVTGKNPELGKKILDVADVFHMAAYGGALADDEAIENLEEEMVGVPLNAPVEVASIVGGESDPDTKD